MDGGNTMKRSAPRMPHIKCPHCGAQSYAKLAAKTDTLYREVYYICREELSCGHAFVVSMAIIRTVRPSMTPNPAVRLPFSQYVRRPANDINPEPANDDGHHPSEPMAAKLIE